MLIEVKVKSVVKTKKESATYLVDKEFFSEAEYAVTAYLNQLQASNTIESFEIQSLKMSPIKEIYHVNEGFMPFIITLQDVFVSDDGTEKPLRYKILLYAADLSEANDRAQVIIREGYNMIIEGIKQVNYIYLTETA